MKTTLFKPKPLSTKTKIIVSKEIVINLKLVLLSLIITFIAFFVFYFALKPNKQEIQNRIIIEQDRITDSIAKATVLADSIYKLASLQSLYDEISKKYDIGTFYEFSEKMEIPEKRKIIFDECNKSLGLGCKDFKEFEYLCGFKENDYKIIDLKQKLRDFVATSNSCKYKTEEELLSKFPELKRYDMQSLRDYVATSNSGKYKTEEELNSRFPEFFGDIKKNNNKKTDKILSEENRLKLDKIVGQMVNNKKTDEDIQLVVDDFKDKYGVYDLEKKETSEPSKPLILKSSDITSTFNIEYEHKMTIFKEEIKDKTLFTFILSLFGLIIGRYFYKLTNIAIKQLILLAKAIKKYSKMDINQN